MHVIRWIKWAEHEEQVSQYFQSRKLLHPQIPADRPIAQVAHLSMHAYIHTSSFICLFFNMTSSCKTYARYTPAHSPAFTGYMGVCGLALAPSILFRCLMCIIVPSRSRRILKKIRVCDCTCAGVFELVCRLVSLDVCAWCCRPCKVSAYRVSSIRHAGMHWCDA